MSEHVRVEKQGPVLSITFARPERRNAITVAMYAALADAVEQALLGKLADFGDFGGVGEEFHLDRPLAGCFRGDSGLS